MSGQDSCDQAISCFSQECLPPVRAHANSLAKYGRTAALENLRSMILEISAIVIWQLSRLVDSITAAQ